MSVDMSPTTRRSERAKRSCRGGDPGDIAVDTAGELVGVGAWAGTDEHVADHVRCIHNLFERSAGDEGERPGDRCRSVYLPGHAQPCPEHANDIALVHAELGCERPVEHDLARPRRSSLDEIRHRPAADEVDDAAPAVSPRSRRTRPCR